MSEWSASQFGERVYPNDKISEEGLYGGSLFDGKFELEKDLLGFSSEDSVASRRKYEEVVTNRDEFLRNMFFVNLRERVPYEALEAIFDKTYSSKSDSLNELDKVRETSLELVDKFKFLDSGTAEDRERKVDSLFDEDSDVYAGLGNKVKTPEEFIAAYNNNDQYRKSVSSSDFDENKNWNQTSAGGTLSDRDIYDSEGMSPEQQRQAQMYAQASKGSQSNVYDGLAKDAYSERDAQILAQNNAQSHEDAMYKDTQTNIFNPNEMADREQQAIDMGLTGSDKDRFIATGISSNVSSQGTTGANKTSAQDAYNGLLNPDDTVVPDDTAPNDLDPGNANNQIDPTDTGVTPVDDSNAEFEESGSSFSGTVTKDDPYRDLLSGQLGQGISDSLAGRPSNSLLAGERMGAEAMARASADNMGVASQGVSNANMIGQGAAQNAAQVVGRANLQQLGDLSAKNTALRGQEQKEARGQAQNYLQYSEGVRQNRVAEDQMKLDSLLDWYRETKSTHVGQADAILDQFDNLADVNMTEDQKAYQIEQANKVGDEGASSDLFKSLKDQGYKQQIASMFQKDPESGRYVRHQNGQTYAVDDATQAMIDAELNLGEVKGLSYNSNGTLVLDDARAFETSLSNAFVAGDIQGLYNSSQYIEKSYTSDNGMLAGGVEIGDVVMIAGHPAMITGVNYSLGQVTYRDHNNEAKIGNN